MMTKDTYTKPGSVDLYRYDLECPPNRWSADYKNMEYVYDVGCDDLKVKNKIGAFFFYENKLMAHCTGSIAAQNNNKNTIWLTNTSIIQEITLLNFSGFENISSILLAFEEFGIDVLNDDFFKYDLNGNFKSFKELRPLLSQLNQLNTKKKWNTEDVLLISDIAKEIGDFFNGNEQIGYFGQLLTDFGNGEAFKSLLKAKGCDGYIFRESHSSKTYCIFEASALSMPVHQEIKV